MTLWQSLSGMLRIRVTSADMGQTLDTLTGLGIVLHHLEAKDPLTAECTVSRLDYPRIAAVCEKRGNTLKCQERKGIFWQGKRLMRRPILVIGMVLLFFLVLILPTRVFFFSVEGNTGIPSNRILEAAQDCGIRFGVSRSTIRSEKMKNALLSTLPELQWAGINTFGCRGVISVRERQETHPQEDFPEITGIVAARDGVLISCTATKGNALYAPGQTVKKGQLLISPYVDCGLSIKVVPAEGEVFAHTNRKLRAVTPAFHTDVRENGNMQHHFSLILGKKRINLWKGSGISDATCGRMYTEYYITLPGGFRLPACLAVESRIPRIGSATEISEPDAKQMLLSFSTDRVSHEMIAGTILSEDTVITRDENLWILDGSFVCSEMIGRSKAERNGDMHE